MIVNIAADWVFPVTSAPAAEATIEIENGRIRSIRPVGRNDRRIRGGCIVPGFVNAHTHLAYTSFRNLYDDLPFFQWIRRLTEEKKNWTDEQIVSSTRKGIIESLRGGVTTVADMSDLLPALKELTASPLRGIYYWEVFGVEKDQAERSWNFLQNDFAEIKKVMQTDRLQIGVSPHSCYTVRPEFYSRIAQWAIEDKIPVSFHAAESKAEEEFIANRSGVIYDFLKIRSADWPVDASSSISHLEQTGILSARPLLAHMVQASLSDIAILQRYGASVAHCPKSNAKFAHGIAPLFNMLQGGLTVGLGTDSAASNNRLDLFEEARFAMLQSRAVSGEMILDAQKVLEMLTIDGAKAMGMADEIGSLECGKKADFIVIKIPDHYSNPQQVLHHLIYTACAADVLQVFIDGRELDLSALEKA